MKTTPRKTLRPTAAADRPGGVVASPELQVFALRPAPARPDLSGLFTGGETLH